MKKCLAILALVIASLPAFAQVDDAYTTTLLHFDGDFVDQAGDTWTSSNASISTTITKFGSGAFYSDGTQRYIYSNASPGWEFGTGPWTVDFWAYYPSSLLKTQFIVSWFTPSPLSGFDFRISNLDKFAFSEILPGTGSITDPATFPIGEWVHVAVSRDADSIRMFRNGTLVQAASATVDVASQTETRRIGSDGTVNAYDFGGYIDELRISKGIARWTADFTPPTSAYGPDSDTSGGGILAFAPGGIIGFCAPSGDITGSYTAMLAHFDSGLDDESGFTWADTSASVSTSVYRFGGGSLSVSATESYVLRGSVLYQMEGDWTWEAWYRAETHGGTYHTLFSVDNGAGGITFRLDNDIAGLYSSFGFATQTTTVSASSASILDGNWHHVCLGRSSDQQYIGIDGVIASGSTQAGNMGNTINFYLGGRPFAQALNGHIDEARLTIGEALYYGTGTYVIPSSAPGDSTIKTLSFAP